MGTLLERVFKDQDPDQGIEAEYRAKNDKVFVWKLLRKVAETDLKIFEKRYEGSVEDISQDIAAGYGKMNKKEGGNAAEGDKKAAGVDEKNKEKQGGNIKESEHESDRAKHSGGKRRSPERDKKVKSSH